MRNSRFRLSIFFFLRSRVGLLLSSAGVVLFASLALAAASSSGEKIEGEIMWYTTMALDDSTVVVQKFKERYPAINIKLFRSNDSKLLERALAESRANATIADVVSAGTLPIGVLKDKALVTKYIATESAAFPVGAKDPDGYWTNIYINTFNIAYNTTVVAAQSAPKSYDALLNPKWKNNIGMDDSDYEWFGNMLQIMGEKKGLDYMRKLASLKPAMRAGHSLLATLLAAGEFAVYPDGYPRRIEVLRERGARTVDWVWPEQTIAELHPTAIMANAPHPNAARLFTDYLLSAEGQELIGMQFGRVPSRKGVKLKYPRMSIEGRNIHWSNPTLMAEHSARYAELFQSIFGKPQ